MTTVLLNGQMVELPDSPLKSGGQARVFAVPSQPDTVVKLYREPPGAEQERRLARMLAMAPLGGRDQHLQQPPELAWPTALARDTDGAFIGYAMRRFGEPDHLPLTALFSLRGRLRYQADWGFLLGVGWNLAFMTMRMHAERLVVGDFSSNNVVVDYRGFVTFLDCDTIAFTDGRSGEYFPCLLQTADYCAPERFRGEPATEATDNFALAVLIYQLLTCGNHPFGGVPRDGEGEETIQDNIAAGSSYLITPEKVVVPRHLVEPRVLPPALLDLARRAFGPGASDPAARPRAVEWRNALHLERAQVRQCPDIPEHSYSSHLQDCPWCIRVAAGAQDLFRPQPSRPVTTPPEPVPVRSSHTRLLVAIPLIIAVLYLLLFVLFHL